MYVRNTFEFVDRIKDIQLEEDESMVSFDVESLYPSIPVPEALGIIKDWINSQDISDDKAEILYQATKLCMDQNQFEFRGGFYQQAEGTSMGNPLSCFVANIFMVEKEKEVIKKLPLKVWLRYVDDIFAIVKQREIEKTLQFLNDLHPKLKFTIETEDEGSLNFLDLTLKRLGNSIDISVYRKPTSTLRYITSDSYCPYSHKMAALNSMVYRMCKLPLSVQNYMKELNQIKLIGKTNGFSEKEVERLVLKHSKTLKRQKLSTFYKLKNESRRKRLKFAYAGKLTNRIKPIFKKRKTELVFASNRKLKNQLGSCKDLVKNTDKPGIYKISCGDCEASYYGQTRRSILTRYKEHRAHIKYDRPEKSSVAMHAISNQHYNIGMEELKLVKHVQDPKYLDAWESLYLHRNDLHPLMNTDKGPISSNLFLLDNRTS